MDDLRAISSTFQPMYPYGLLIRGLWLIVFATFHTLGYGNQ